MKTKIVLDANSFAVMMRKDIGASCGSDIDSSKIPPDPFEVLTNCRIWIMDVDERMYTEYMNCCSAENYEGLSFSAKYADYLVTGKIVLCHVKPNKEVNDKLHTFSVKSTDRWYVHSAVCSQSEWIVTKDPDFFDPVFKRDTRTCKEKMVSGKGCVAKYLKKKLGVESIHIENAFAIILSE